MSGRAANSSRWIPAVAAAAVCLATVSIARAVAYDLAADVPSDLGGATYTPNQVVRSDDGLYGLDLELPEGVAIGALDRRPDGLWLFSPAHPVRLDGSDYEPRDIVAYDGESYSIFLDGESAGIPPEARIDALLLDELERPVISLDLPVDLGGTLYHPSDLVLAGDAFSLYWDGAAAGVSPGVNLIGAAEDQFGTLVLTFDVPADLSGETFLPGELVRWESASVFSSYFADPAWPPGSQLRGFAFAPTPAGAVPDGDAVPGTPLTVHKEPGGDLRLEWGASCLPGDGDYGVYEGTLGEFTTHGPRLFSTGGATSAILTPAEGGTYYLVVPQSGLREGSYGTDSAGAERPPAAEVCLPQEIGSCP